MNLGHGGPKQVPIGDTLGDFLARFGVADLDTHHAVTDAVEQFCSAHGHQGVEVKSLRWDSVVLECSPMTARFLRYDSHRLEEALEAAGVPHNVVILTRR